MAVFYAEELRGLGDALPRTPGNEAVGGRPRIYRSVIKLDAPALTSTTTGTVVTSADSVVVAKVPPGMRFAGGTLIANISIGAATFGIGIASSVGKYRAAATFTAVDTPTAFGTAAAYAAGPLANEETVVLTSTAGNLANNAGGLLIVELEFVGV